MPRTEKEKVYSCLLKTIFKVSIDMMGLKVMDNRKMKVVRNYQKVKKKEVLIKN